MIFYGLGLTQGVFHGADQRQTILAKSLIYAW